MYSQEARPLDELVDLAHGRVSEKGGRTGGREGGRGTGRAEVKKEQRD
jgi:hypothetical protein